MDFITPFLNYIMQCDVISSNKLFLNAVGNPDDGTKQVVTSAIDRKEDKEYVDGSVRHKIIFTIFDYHSLSFNELCRTMLENSENVEKLLEVQKVVDWVILQNKNGNFPDFGADYEVESIEPTCLTPTTPSIDTADPLIAKYSIPIVCYVMDYTEAIR